MQMTFRWYNSSDAVKLEHIKQMPYVICKRYCYCSLRHPRWRGLDTRGYRKY